MPAVETATAQGIAPPSPAGQLVAAGIFLPTNYGTITDGGSFGDGLAHPASSNGFATLGALQAVYPFATATSNDMAGLMVQAAINANDAAGYGYVQGRPGKKRVTPAGIVFPANTNAQYVGGGPNDIFMCANVGSAAPCITANAVAGNNARGPISNVAFWGFNSIVPSSLTGAGVPAAPGTVYNPGTVGMFFKQNAGIVYNGLTFYNFDMPFDWDVSTGGNYTDVFRDCYFYYGNQGPSIDHWAVNSFERMSFDGGISGNNNHGAVIVSTTAATTISSGTYNSGTGAVSLTTAAAHGISVGQTFIISAAAGSGNYGWLNSVWVAAAGTTGTTLNLTQVTGLTIPAITGGNVFRSGAGSGFATDIYFHNFSFDYNIVEQLYYIGGTGATGLLNSVYIDDSHLETNASTSGSGSSNCRVNHDGNVSFSQNEWFESGINPACLVNNLTSGARTWVNGDKQPGNITSDAAAYGFITASGSSSSGGVGLSSQSAGRATLLKGGAGFVSGYKQYDPRSAFLTGAVTFGLFYQNGPLVAIGNTSLTIPFSSTSNLESYSVTQITILAGVTVTFVPATFVTFNGPTVWGGTQSTIVYLTNVGSNTWTVSSTPSSTGAVTAVAGAALLNTVSGTVTSEALTSATTYTLTLSDNLINSTSKILVNATDSAGQPVTLTSITPGSGTASIVVGMPALTGTVLITFAIQN